MNGRNSFKAKAKSREKRNKNRACNCLQEVLLELMEERKLKDAEVVKATGISWSVWDAWITGKSRVQLLDGNMLALSKFFNCSINYLAFGIGEGPTELENQIKE